jgi:hypothetical protein
VAGFELEATHYHLFFEDPKLHGLEVVMSRMSVDDSLALDRARFAKASTLEDLTKNTEDVTDIVGEHLVSWNLERGGLPVSCDAKGLRSHDGSLLDAIVDAYVQAVRGVPAPLALSSSDTGTSSSDGSASPTVSVEQSIPMEPLSSPQ